MYTNYLLRKGSFGTMVNNPQLEELTDPITVYGSWVAPGIGPTSPAHLNLPLQLARIGVHFLNWGIGLGLGMADYLDLVWHAQPCLRAKTLCEVLT